MVPDACPPWTVLIACAFSDNETGRPMTDAPLQRLARVFVDGFSEMDGGEQRLARSVYRALTDGQPVEPRDAALAAGLEPARALASLRSWPTVFWDEAGRITGFLGLGTAPTRHRFEVDNGVAYTWCAWDALFVPQIIGAPARVTSRCPATEETISLVVRPDGIESVSPAEVVLSFLMPAAAQLGEQVTGSFCQFVHFLRPGRQSERWLGERPQLFEMSLERAFELGGLVNRERFAETDLSIS